MIMATARKTTSQIQGERFQSRVATPDQLERRRAAFRAYVSKPADTPVSATELQAAAIYGVLEDKPSPDGRSSKPGGKQSREKRAKVVAQLKAEAAAWSKAYALAKSR
jgi:hypothetical protein